MSPSPRHYVLLTFVLFAVGLLGALAYGTSPDPDPAEAAGTRQPRLVTVVEALEDKRERLESELETLRSEVVELEEQEAARQGVQEHYSTELARLRMLAGLEPVRGTGLVVTLEDNPRPPENAPDVNNYIIHDYDVRAIVNALWAGGAEAISVNDERLVQSTAVRCVGTTILVNNSRLAAPFVVSAIGDPTSMRRSLEADEDSSMLLDDYSRVFGLKSKVEDGEDITLPGYRGTIAPRELEPAPSDPAGAQG
jgi:uncharacterized protein YlxW (UPF0749 family)